jgi:hypothetical protein
MARNLGSTASTARPMSARAAVGGLVLVGFISMETTGWETGVERLAAMEKGR